MSKKPKKRNLKCKRIDLKRFIYNIVETYFLPHSFLACPLSSPYIFESVLTSFFAACLYCYVIIYKFYLFVVKRFYYKIFIHTSIPNFFFNSGKYKTAQRSPREPVKKLNKNRSLFDKDVLNKSVLVVTFALLYGEKIEKKDIERIFCKMYDVL